jgi:hypothetical protein
MTTLIYFSDFREHKTLYLTSSRFTYSKRNVSGYIARCARAVRVQNDIICQKFPVGTGLPSIHILKVAYEKADELEFS